MKQKTPLDKKLKKKAKITVKIFADVTDDKGKVHKVLERQLPFMVENGRKHMLRLRRERQLNRGKS